MSGFILDSMFEETFHDDQLVTLLDDTHDKLKMYKVFHYKQSVWA